MLAAALLVLGAPAHDARAAHPLVSDDTGTQGAGHWQFEANTDHTRVRDDGVTVRVREYNVTLTRGMTETLDVAVNAPWLQTSASGASTERGAGDATVLAKWRYFDDGNGWTLGLRPEFTLPTGSERKGLGNGRATASLTLLSHVERGAWTWLVNAGATYNDNKAGERKQLWAASTAVLYALGASWTLAADIGVARAAEPGAANEKYGLVGLIYHHGDDVDLDIVWRRTKGDGPAARMLGVGLTLRW
ncbi:MAG: transporter [Proteobacteria bacterium]|nr:transporter [Pseudomonadota bacterium]